MLLLFLLIKYPIDNVIYFGHHEDTNYFLRPALEVPAIEASNVRDRERSGFAVGHVVGVS